MKIVQARFEIERVRQERGEIEQVGCAFGDARTAVVSVYFVGDEGPLDLLADLEVPVTEAIFDHRALSAALLSCTDGLELLVWPTPNTTRPAPEDGPSGAGPRS